MPTDTPTKRPLRVALIGFGAIGAELYRVLQALPDLVDVRGALVSGANAAPAPPLGADPGPARWHSLAQLLHSAPDIVVECAGHQAVDAYGEQVLRSGHDLLLVSVGALADVARHVRLSHAARDSGRQLLLASGAIGGLDILGAARRAGLRFVQYRSRKPPAAWRGTAAETCVDLAALTGPTVFFSGSARMAALAYPKNANVAATIALAGLGFDDTRVELIADPQVDGNVHEIEADGASGHLSIRIDGRASSRNPKTSMVTAYSLANALLNRRAAVVI
jgi:aspartate dehydrogenase